jgi:hypothetical protein
VKRVVLLVTVALVLAAMLTLGSSVRWRTPALLRPAP